MPKKPKKDELITLSQAAELYGFAANYLRKLAERGRLEAQKLGAQWVTTPGAVETFIKSRVVRGVYREDIK